ncbi:hypothetical protein HY768_08890 [candidate division TA06 bacterium]|uniref:Radical SAM protein n=1 Tax=candidate division TA06 bacterium TaxID=2250710 RepID=A0A933IC83_UNCT6|nr:hypothetical protein [candidate division TA06 bacterium]
MTRSQEARGLLASCQLCPRQCGVNRAQNQKGFCRSGRLPIVSSYNAHLGEEPPISGSRGSGTIFFANCNMACVYCQNWPISQLGQGQEVTFDRLAGMMLELQERGCHNINFVTPSHMIAQILIALPLAVETGFNLPLVYNSSGYDSQNSLKLMDGVVDIYLPEAETIKGKAVRHSVWGRGQVVDIEGDGDDMKLSIVFKGGVKKKIMAGFVEFI